MTPFTFSSTKSIISEIGGTSKITELCRSLNITRPLIITDKGIVENGLVAAVTNVFNATQMQYKENSTAPMPKFPDVAYAQVSGRCL